MKFKLYLFLGILLTVGSLLGLLSYFYPILLQEVHFVLKRPNSESIVAFNQPEDKASVQNDVQIPVDENFSIVIPKIGANSKVIANVDPFNSKEYQIKLAFGIAHAKGTALPDEAGNSFYFAHSAQNVLVANQYNSVFYLLSKLEFGDTFYIAYKKQIYQYQVTKRKVIDPDDLSYLKGDLTKKTATLMTCWPAGTTFRRFVVIGEQVP